MQGVHLLHHYTTFVAEESSVNCGKWRAQSLVRYTGVRYS